MRIIYSLRKQPSGIWIVECLSDSNISQSKHDSLSNAVDSIIGSYQDIKNLDVVIPLSIPKPIRFKVPKIKKANDLSYAGTVFNTWGHKPIPKTTIEFKYKRHWIIATQPYRGRNIYYFKHPLPDELIITVIKGIGTRPLRVINGVLKKDVTIELESCKAHVFRTSKGIKLEFLKYV